MLTAYSKDMQTVDAHTFQEAVGILNLPPGAGLPARANPPDGPGRPRPRRPARTLPILAAAVLLAVIVYTFYPRPLAVPIKYPSLK